MRAERGRWRKRKKEVWMRGFQGQLCSSLGGGTNIFWEQGRKELQKRKNKVAKTREEGDWLVFWRRKDSWKPIFHKSGEESSKDNPKRNSPPSPQHHHPAPLQEDLGEEKSYRPPKEGALEALSALLHLPLSRLPRSDLVPTLLVSPLLGPNHSPLLSPPHLLCLCRSYPSSAASMASSTSDVATSSLLASPLSTSGRSRWGPVVEDEEIEKLLEPFSKEQPLALFQEAMEKYPDFVNSI